MTGNSWRIWIQLTLDWRWDLRLSLSDLLSSCHHLIIWKIIHAEQTGMKGTIVVCQGLLDLYCGLKVFVVTNHLYYTICDTEHTEFYFLENGHFQHFSCNNSCSDEVLSISLTSFQKLVCEGDNSFTAEHWTFYWSLGRISTKNYITIMLATSIKACLK